MASFGGWKELQL